MYDLSSLSTVRTARDTQIASDLMLTFAALSLSLVMVAAGYPGDPAGLDGKSPAKVQRQMELQTAVPRSSAGLVRTHQPAARLPAACPPVQSATGGTESGLISDILVLLLGTLLSLYATVVFERRKRFGEILRDVARTRAHFQGYPVSPGPKNLEYAHTETVKFAHFLEDKQWGLAADGHDEAARLINRLYSFIFRVAACIENMQSKNTKGLAVDQYLSEFQSQFQQIYDGEFRQYEGTIHPSIWALIRPLPNPVIPKSLRDGGGDYFLALL